MTGSKTKRRLGTVLRYIFGAVLCLVAGLNVLVGSPWYLSLGVFVSSVVIILGRRRIIAAGVSKTPREVVVRYVPWYEGNVYVLNVAIPLLGIAMIAAGYAPGYPSWSRYGGILLVVLTPLFTSSAVRMWRRSSLRITPSALAIRLAAPKDEPIEIPRECVQSIAPKVVPNGVGGKWLQVEIAYWTGDSDGGSTKTVLLGLQLTVEPFNLLSALTAWKEFGHDAPTLLLDRVEQALRDRSTTQA